MSAETNSGAEETGAEAAKFSGGVGALLRETREKAGLEIKDVAGVLRISARYLEAIELGRDEDLPGATYAVGFVRSYAEYLDLDGEEIVRRYKEAAAGVGRAQTLTFPKPIPDSGVPGGVVLIVGLALAAGAYGLWHWTGNRQDTAQAPVEPVPQLMAETAEAAADTTASQSEAVPAEAAEAAQEEVAAVSEATQPDAPAEDTAAMTDMAAPEPMPQPVQEAVAEPAPEAAAMPAAEAVAEAVAEPVEEAVQEAEPIPAAEPAEPEPAAAPQEAAPAPQAEPLPEPDTATASQAVEDFPSRITIRAKSSSWIQVRDESTNLLLYTRLMREGDEYKVPTQPGIMLSTGNAGALEILVDGALVPPIGEAGQVRRNVNMDPELLKAGDAGGI